MQPVFVAPRLLLEKKPKHGSPCNQCGLCCIATVCPLGSIVFGKSNGPCPALEWEGGESRCGLVTQNTGPVAEAAAHLIGAGTGCDARFNGEPPDMGFYLKLIREDFLKKEKTAWAKKIWGIE
jgi:hypothetical protein